MNLTIEELQAEIEKIRREEQQGHRGSIDFDMKICDLKKKIIRLKDKHLF